MFVRFYLGDFFPSFAYVVRELVNGKHTVN